MWFNKNKDERVSLELCTNAIIHIDSKLIVYSTYLLLSNIILSISQWPFFFENCFVHLIVFDGADVR